MAFTVSIDARGLERAINSAPDAIMDAIGKGVKQGLVDIQRTARRVHRFKSKSGNLARSVTVDFDIKRPGTGIYLDMGLAKYAGWVHEGTPAHVITPKNKKMLRWVGKGAKYIFAKRVNHPGTKPDQFLFQAANSGLSNLQAKVNASVAKVLARLFGGK